MKLIKTKLEGAFIIETEPIVDKRGSFKRIFCVKELVNILPKNKKIVQINHSISKQKGAFRGFHFQKPPMTEIKIVQCLQGKIFDIIVDIRQNSSTFLNWQGFMLSRRNQLMLYIPEGFAHGFQTLTKRVEMIYFHTNYYSSEHEGALRFDEPRIEINFPLKVTNVSDRDKNHPFIDKNFNGLKVLK